MPPASSIASAPAPPSASEAAAPATPSPPAEESATGKPIVITEIDIENIIRTKASIYSACALMLSQVGLRFEDLRHIYIAGGFGRFLDLENATVIGLIPDLPREKFRYIGNSSLMGSYMVVVSQDYRQRQLELARTDDLSRTQHRPRLHGAVHRRPVSAAYRPRPVSLRKIQTEGPREWAPSPGLRHRCPEDPPKLLAQGLEACDYRLASQERGI